MSNGRRSCFPIARPVVTITLMCALLALYAPRNPVHATRRPVLKSEPTVYSGPGSGGDPLDDGWAVNASGQLTPIDVSTGVAGSSISIGSSSSIDYVSPNGNYVFTSDALTYGPILVTNAQTGTALGDVQGYRPDQNGGESMFFDPSSNTAYLQMPIGGSSSTDGFLVVNLQDPTNANGDATTLTITDNGSDLSFADAEMTPDGQYIVLTTPSGIYEASASTGDVTAGPITHTDPSTGNVYSDYEWSAMDPTDGVFAAVGQDADGDYAVVQFQAPSMTFLSAASVPSVVDTSISSNPVTGEILVTRCCYVDGAVQLIPGGSDGDQAETVELPYLERNVGTFSADGQYAVVPGGSELMVLSSLSSDDPTVSTMSVPSGTISVAFLPSGDLINVLGTQPGAIGNDPSSCGCASDSTNPRPTNGDPVDPASGNFQTSATDVSVPGTDPPLAFTRTYNSSSAESENTPGALGYGWSDNLDMSVSVSGSQATLTEENGAQDTFNTMAASSGDRWCDDESSFVNPPTGATLYCPSAPRISASLYQKADGTWIFTRYDAGTETFDFSSAGALTGYSNNEGAVNESSYTGACVSGDTCIQWTEGDSSAASLVVASDSAGQVVSVFNPDASDLTATYAYIAGQLISVSDGAGTAPLTYSYGYDYGSPFDLSCTGEDDGGANVLTTERDPGASAPVQNCYNANGWDVEQENPAGAITDFDYDPDIADYLSPTGALTTVTSYPDGLTGTANETQYFYEENVLVDETSGVGTPDITSSMTLRDGSSLGASQSIDGDGNDTYNTFATDATPVSSDDVTLSVDAMGNTTQTGYTTDNQVYCTVAPSEYAAGIRCPSSVPSWPPTTSYPGATISYFSGDEMVGETDPLGNTTAYSYTPAGDGAPAGLQYCSVEPSEYAQGVACPAYSATDAPSAAGSTYVPGTSEETFSSAGEQLTSTNADGDETQYTYESTDPYLTATETSPDGSVTSFTYDGAGQVTKQVVSFDGYSATTIYGYDSSGRLFCTISPLSYSQGNSSCPSAAPTGGPLDSGEWSGVTTTGESITVYDAEGNPTYQVSALRGVTETAYDGDGNAVCTVSPNQYAAGTRCPSTPSTSAVAGATITVYNADGLATEVFNPLGGETSTTYDQAGNVLASTVSSNDSAADPPVTTAYAYNADSQVTSTTMGSDNPSEDTYDSDGDAFCSATSDADWDGDACTQLGSAISPSAPPNPVELSSDPSSPYYVPRGATLSFYDADGNETETVGPEWTNSVPNVSISAYGRNGGLYCSIEASNVAAAISSGEITASSSYPYLCPSTPVETSGATVTAYDPDGNVTSTTNPVGDTTSYTYSPGGLELTATDGSQTSTYCYYYETSTCAASAPLGGGQADDLYSVTSPPSSADPSGEVSTTSYFPGDETDVTTTPGGTTTDSYNHAGDVTSVAYGASSGYGAVTRQTFTYFPDGTTETMTDATGTTSYEVNALDEQTASALSPAAGFASTYVAHAYYSTGQLESVTYPEYAGEPSTPTATYTYDSNGNMASVSDWLDGTVTFASDGNGNLTSQTANTPSGTSTTEWSYDGAGENIGVNSQAGRCNELQSFSPNYSTGFGTGSRNADGQLTEYYEYEFACNPLPNGSTGYQRNYSYDAAGELVYQGGSPQGSSSDNFAYNAAGDVTELSARPSEASDIQTYDDSVNGDGQVTAQTLASEPAKAYDETFTYDGLGDQVNSQVTGSDPSYSASSYNSIGEMTDDTTAAGSTSYVYNGEGLESDWRSTSSASFGDFTPTGVGSAYVAVSCASTAFCVGLNDSGYENSWNGTSWGTSVAVDTTGTVTSVSCATTTSFCVAVDAEGNWSETTDGGSAWSSPAAVATGSPDLTSVSCASVTFCEAVATNGYAYKFNGTSWKVSSGSISGSSALYAVSCHSTLCEAVGANGVAVRYDSGWGAPADVDGSTTLEAISCPTNSFCAATDSAGQALTYSSSGWSSPTQIDADVPVNSISCASAAFCEAADTEGNAVELSGSDWALSNVDGSNAITGVSCAAASNCVAVDAEGQVDAFQAAGANTSGQIIWDDSGQTPDVIDDGAYDYIYGPDGEPVEQVNLSTSAQEFLFYTAADSSWYVTNASGGEVSFYEYDAYGALAAGTPASEFGYAGQYSDAASISSGLVDMRARWYSPSTGSFTSVDPLVSQTLDPYGYAGGDPVNESDPAGLCNQQGNGNGWDLFNPWSQNNPLYCWGLNNPQTARTVGSLDPAYDAISGYYDEYVAAQDPCSSDWTIAGDAFEGTVGFVGTGLAAFGGLTDAAGLNSLDDAGGIGGRVDPNQTVGETLQGKLGSINRAPLPPGTPPLSEISDMTMGEVRAAAQARERGFQALWKLLNDSRFNK